MEKGMKILKRIAHISALSLILISDAFSADTLRMDPVHSSVEFSIRHLVGRVMGRFKEFSGTIVYDEKKIQNSSVQVTIKTSSIDTENEKRDGHLRSPDFFDTEKYPEITFQSKRVIKKDGKAYAVGPLNIHGIEKEIRLPFKVLGLTRDSKGNTWAGFEAEIIINRYDFDITWNRTLEDRGFLLGDEVNVNIFIEAMKMTEEKEKKEE